MRVSKLMNILEAMSEAEKLDVIATVSQRMNLEICVEKLIALLDIMDGDENLEPDNDNEPSLGAPEHVTQTHWYLPVGLEQTDLEIEDENDEDGGDAEPNGDELDSNFSEDGY
ncbi:hypothetical protein HFO94_27845 [Rhizobium leguminosarum]|uniref:hypothetical protein n=1 Tax=Rhizobium leguminosarum TaxID=384 RepID=UPI001C95DFDF|nr:hypothetical protein [Rhizobium leguminosarum]MBY5357296.1 hypothetical protein [Rhizobium leguminosarum]